MRLNADGTLRLSPSDLASYLACAHLTQLESASSEAHSRGRSGPTRGHVLEVLRPFRPRRRTCPALECRQNHDLTVGEPPYRHLAQIEPSRVEAGVGGEAAQVLTVRSHRVDVGEG